MSKKRKKSKINWKRVRKVAMWTTIVVGTYEIYLAAVIRRQHARDTFNAALQRANETGKPLVVLGDPEARLANKIMGRDHDCASMCIDDAGCPSCTDVDVMTGRLEDALPQIGTDSSVIYVSHKLEYVDNINLVLSELQRVGGGDVYVSSIEPYSVLAWLNPFVKRRILQLPTRTDPIVAWRNKPWLPGPADVEEQRVA